MKDFDGKAYLHLENWDSSLAVTTREERLACEGVMHSSVGRGKVRISKDGNYQGPYAFRMDFPSGFRPNMSYLEELEKWQKMEFPSPYLNARRFEAKDPKARKRVVAVLHELLSLTIEKRPDDNCVIGCISFRVSVTISITALLDQASWNV